MLSIRLPNENYITYFKQAWFFTYIIITIHNALYSCLSISNTITKIEKNAKKQNIKNVLKSLGKSTFWFCSFSWFNIYRPYFNVDFNFQWNYYLTYQRPMAILYFAFFLQMAFFCPLTFAQLPAADSQVFLVRKKKFQANNFH